MVDAVLALPSTNADAAGRKPAPRICVVATRLNRITRLRPCPHKSTRGERAKMKTRPVCDRVMKTTPPKMTDERPQTRGATAVVKTTALSKTVRPSSKRRAQRPASATSTRRAPARGHPRPTPAATPPSKTSPMRPASLRVRARETRPVPAGRGG